MKTAISAETKTLFKELRDRRRRLGIEYGKWCLLCDTAAHQSLTEYWASYREMLGREKATDYLIYLLDFGYHQLKIAQRRKRGRRRTEGF
jgi:hypothetical protein